MFLESSSNLPNTPGMSTGIYLDRRAMKKKAISRFFDIAFVRHCFSSTSSDRCFSLRMPPAEADG
jgi:hypothetical protein